MARSISKDFYSGIMFALFGTAAMFFSTAYRIGSAANMGPGYFPFALGGLLVLLGIAILLRSLFKRTESRAILIRFKPPLFVLSSVVLFGLALQPLGLLVSTFLLVVVSSLASDEFRWREALINAGLLGCLVLVVFVYLLKFQVPVWPGFLSLRP